MLKYDCSGRYVAYKKKCSMNIEAICISKDKILVSFLFTFFLTACDPALNEKIVINNNTSKLLTITIEKKGNFKDTTEFYYQYDYKNKRRFLGDTLLIVDCSVNSGSKLILLDFGPLGTMSIDSKDDGMFYLEEITDTIFLNNYLLKKTIKDKDSWDLYVDSYKNGGGVSEFSFTINDNDIE